MKLRLTSLLSLFVLALLLIVGLSVDTRQSAAAPAGSNFTYLPMITKPYNLTIAGLEISQSVQDASNGVPLVANRPTVVRVYTETGDGSNVPNASVTLTATRGGTPLTPVTSNTQTASGASNRANLNSTFNVVLPASWLSGTVQITAKVNGQTGSGFMQTFTFNTVPALNVVIVPIDYYQVGASGDRKSVV